MLRFVKGKVKRASFTFNLLHITIILHSINLLTKKIDNDIIKSKKWEKVTKDINNEN